MQKGALILAGLSAGILVGVSYSKSPALTSPASPAPTVTSLAAPVQYSFKADAPPVRLKISILGVDAPIEAVGIAPDGSMEVVRSFTKVGWYKYGPYPGAIGKAVIEGHLDAVDSPIAVFSKLEHLTEGDAITVVDAEKRTATFTVTHTAYFPYNSTSTEEIFGPADDGSYLNLITCAGNWIRDQKTYDHRLIVFTKRIK